MAGSMKTSCPGKVLVSGGYTIIEPPNKGISLAVSARCYATLLFSLPRRNTSPLSTTVEVRSPQLNCSFSYKVEPWRGSEKGWAGIVVSSVQEPSSAFFHAAIFVVASYFRERWFSVGHIAIQVEGDNAFYGQRKYLKSLGHSLTASSYRTNIPPLRAPLEPDAGKTGLGSSAAITTSFVALLSYFFTLSGNEEREERDGELAYRRIHRMSQLAHCLAQGKIGSGFDVCTAVYGSCCYERFAPSLLEGVMEAVEGSLGTQLAGEGRRLMESIDASTPWVDAARVELPDGVRLLLGDVDGCGTTTPGMVSAVMQWRRAQGGERWKAACDAAASFQTSFAALREGEGGDGYCSDFREASTSSSDAWPNTSPFYRCASAAKRWRHAIRSVGHAAGVPIEPAAFTALLDATAVLHGVMAVGCPGAGGLDAIFAMVVGDEAASSVEALWEAWQDATVCVLPVEEDAKGLLFH